MQDVVLFLQQHWLLTLAFAMTLAALLIIETIRQKHATSQISPAQLTQLINREDAAVVDVRSEVLFSQGHIIGATSIPFAEMKEKIKKLLKLKNRPIVLVCAQGQESAQAAAALTKQGFNVRLLAGGMRAWRDAGMPVIKE